ncbi:MAG: outer membrane beta-barrel protein [Acidobacteriota bacterium]
MRHTVGALAACGLVLGMAATAFAQSGAPARGFIGVNGGYQPTSGDFNDNIERTRFDETERISITHGVDSGALIDFSAGYFVMERVSVGIGVHRMSSSSTAAVGGSVPHPIFFSRPRSFAVAADGLDRTELGVHLSVGYSLPVMDKLDVRIFAGPTAFRLTQDVVGEVTVSEAGAPFSSVNAAATGVERKRTAWGGHIGADISYLFVEGDAASMGAGLFLRYAGASTDVDLINRAVSTDVGGFQVGAGLRVRF